MGLRYLGKKMSKKKTSRDRSLRSGAAESVAQVDFFGFDARLFIGDLYRTLWCTLATMALLLGIWWWGR